MTGKVVAKSLGAVTVGWSLNGSITARTGDIATVTAGWDIHDVKTVVSPGENIVTVAAECDIITKLEMIR